MKHESFKIIWKGEELDYPMMRIVIIWAFGFIAGQTWMMFLHAMAT